MFGCKKKSSKKNNLKEWIKAIVIAVIVALFIRTFIIQSFTVTSSHMESSLYSGDYIFVNKLKFGARSPITLLSLPFSNNIYTDIIQLPYWRLPAFGSLKRGDVVVFNYPMENDPPIDKKSRYIKRLIGFPGDTLLIDDKIAYANGVTRDSSFNLKYKFRIVTNGEHFTDSILCKFKITEGGIVADMGIFDFFVSRTTADSLKNLDFVNTVRELKEIQGDNSFNYFPQNNYSEWNKDYFGPLVIPKKGATVELTFRNIEIYKRIIEIYEKNKLFVERDKILINDVLSTNYTFKNDYYFVLDDNRDNAKDSRNWGFLPEDHIIGVASFIWFSIENSEKGNSVRWNRIFKSVN